MGISIGWVALLLGVTGAQPADKNAAQITYTVRMIEAEGVGWRASVMSQLKPVTRQGSATIWTLPARASTLLIKEFEKDSAVTLSTAASRVVAFSGVPATIQVRENRKFVTKVSWNGDEAPATGTPEDLRVGWHTTLVGRKLDQGILVKMVLEDTEVRAVHEMPIDAPSHAKPVDAATSATTHGHTTAKAVASISFEDSPFEAPVCPVATADQENRQTVGTSYQEIDLKSIAEPELGSVAPCPGWTFKELTTKALRRDNRLLQLPEIASQEILGEWLIPNGECLLVSFGPHTEADKDGKAVVRERLAFIEADAKPVVVTTQRAMMAPHLIVNPVNPAATTAQGTPPVVYLPQSPIFNPVPGFPSGGAPALPPAAYVPTPVIPLPPGRYMHDDVKYFPSGPDFPWAATQAATQRARMRAMGIEPPPPIERAPAAAAPSAPNGPTRMPAVPSRSFPEGVHVDGSKAKLPPLPEDEMDDDDSAESESAEPRPSPQTKKPRKPKAKPAADESTTKASFVKPKSPTFILPSVFLPGSSVGFQFLLPITPLSIKLPFNQRLVIEIFGRVVPDTRVVETAN